MITKEFFLLFSNRPSHVPNKGEQMVRYYGYYSNVARGKRKINGADDKIPCILKPELTDHEFRRNWARLIRKIYEVDPLVCPKFSGNMRVIVFTEYLNVIKKILVHLGLWDVKRKPRPLANAQPMNGFPAYNDPQGPSVDDYINDPIQWRLIFKAVYGHTGYPCPKFRPLGAIGEIIIL